MRGLANIARFLVGVLFIFSGWVKANDTLGFSYKLIDYFEIFGTDFLIPTALPLTIIICIFEMVAGFSLLIGARLKLTLWTLLLLILFFTFLAFYSAYFNKGTTGGGFGDALPLSSWKSFTKDLVLLILVIILFIGKNEINAIFGPRLENALLVMALIAATVFPLYTYNYLPVVDFRPYAIGKNITAQTTGVLDELKSRSKLRDKRTGNEKILDRLPDNYETDYEFIEQITEVTKKGAEAKIRDFVIYNYKGDDCTQKIIENPNVNFLLICANLETVNRDAFGKINDLAILCKQDHVKFIALTAATKEEIEQFKKEVETDIDFYITDATILRTMIRSNPGLMLLKGGTVQDKWHYHSLPSFTDVKQKHFKKESR
ncbi:MAG TPA: DoxX family protein [Bacteroidia bacterium]|nr:DoxX family protein [Bacteroidia bacterium]HRG52085.1 DoxX family protein [Bacteroidia bacterium]